MHGQVQMDLQRAKVHIECNKHELQKFMSLMIGAQKRQASNNLLIETQFQKMQKMNLQGHELKSRDMAGVTAPIPFWLK